jgi:hypothetical protein
VSTIAGVCWGCASLLSVYYWGSKLLSVYYWGSKLLSVYYWGSKLLSVYYWGSLLLGLLLGLYWGIGATIGELGGCKLGGPTRKGKSFASPRAEITVRISLLMLSGALALSIVFFRGVC